MSVLGLALLLAIPFLALVPSPYRAEEWNRAGLARLEDHEPAAAAEAFRKAVQAWPRSARYHYNLGVAYLRAQRVNEAIPCFEEALRLDPAYSEATRALAMAHVISKHGPQRPNAVAPAWAEGG